MDLSNFLNIFGFQDNDKRFELPKNYFLKKEYQNFSIEDFNNDWIIGERHGDDTQNFKIINNYFQNSHEFPNTLKSTIRIENNLLKLGVKYEPKEFPEKNQYPLFKSGKIESRNEFHYGIIQVTAKVPNNKYLWPGIWLRGKNSWPPEIDIVEFYNKFRPQYASSNNIIAQPNLHYVDKNGNNTNVNVGSKYVMHPDERYVKYTVWWEKEFIRIYFDDYLVYECTDKFILNQFQQPMYLILDNAVEQGVNLSNKDIELLKNGDNWFNITNIKYFIKRNSIKKEFEINK